MAKKGVHLTASSFVTDIAKIVSDYTMLSVYKSNNYDENEREEYALDSLSEVRFEYNRNMSQPLVKFYNMSLERTQPNEVEIPLSSVEFRRFDTVYDGSWFNCTATVIKQRWAQTRASEDGLCMEYTLNAYFMEKLFDGDFDLIQDQFRGLHHLCIENSYSSYKMKTIKAKSGTYKRYDIMERYNNFLYIIY